MITVKYNGEDRHFEHTLLSKALVEIEGIDTHCCAIALNQSFIPRSDYPNTYLNNGDYLEVVTPMQGG